MDNKITKKRLGNFLSYEWILIIFIVFISIFLFDGFYSIIAVRPTVGQEFKVYYDENFSGTDPDKLQEMIDRNNTLSYDVLKVDYEVLTPAADVNILNIRLSVYEGDIIITDNAPADENAAEPKVRSEYVIDTESLYTLDKLLSDAKTYLGTFVKDGADKTDLSYANLDKEKIDAAFLTRMKKDNRFRSNEQKEQGKLQERKRIEKLCVDVAGFEKFLNTAPEEYFYRYTKYTCLKELRKNTDLGESYEKRYQEEVKNNLSKYGRQDARYGINLGALTKGKTEAQEYFKLNKAENANNTVMLAFDFLEHQPELQFECISFMCTVLRECSNILG